MPIIFVPLQYNNNISNNKNIDIMKQIKLVEIFECGSSNTMILDVCPETFSYISYLVNSSKRSQINIIIL